MNLILIRDLFTSRETMGKMEVGGRTYDTIEPPWVVGDDPGEDGGEPGKSCVPEGIYQLVPHNTPTHPFTFALVNEELDVVHFPTQGKRDSVLVHTANWARQLKGCIAPGLHRIQDSHEWMVMYSKAALKEIMNAVPWVLGHTIEIRKEEDL